ncbi:MAG: hypothetical protein HFJ27_00070 [Clostridia bacterium]|nr:hypothetical protein [Clostridia bacterium]
MEKREIVKERIKSNEKIFSDKELRIAQKNQQLITKIYMLESMDAVNLILGGKV